MAHSRLTAHVNVRIFYIPIIKHNFRVHVLLVSFDLFALCFLWIAQVDAKLLGAHQRIRGFRIGKW
jgi:hypothetical protein